MFFKKKKNKSQPTPEIKEEENIFEESNENIDFESESDTEQSTNTLTPRESYSIVLSMFLKTYEDLDRSRDRFSTMMNIGVIDEESMEIIDDLIFEVENCIDTYNILINSEDNTINLLDQQCKNIDYKIRKSLEIEKEAIEMVNKGIEKGDTALAQKGLDHYSKALNIMNPNFEEIKEVLLETNMYL